MLSLLETRSPCSLFFWMPIAEIYWGTRVVWGFQVLQLNHSQPNKFSHEASKRLLWNMNVIHSRIHCDCRTQLPQAVGSAYAMKMASTPACVVAFFGDGGSSEVQLWNSFQGCRFCPANWLTSNIRKSFKIICRESSTIIKVTLENHWDNAMIRTSGLKT